jgi:predicted nucleotidyltransferase
MERAIMKDIIQSKIHEIAKICAKRLVLRLAVFGSATGDDFDIASSDLDFLVEFHPMPPAQHADSYFGLQEDLERLFGLPVDLVERAPIRNPYFLKTVEETQVVVYDAA